MIWNDCRIPEGNCGIRWSSGWASQLNRSAFCEWIFLHPPKERVELLQARAGEQNVIPMKENNYMARENPNPLFLSKPIQYAWSEHGDIWILDVMDIFTPYQWIDDPRPLWSINHNWAMFWPWHIDQLARYTHISSYFQVHKSWLLILTCTSIGTLALWLKRNYSRVQVSALPCLIPKWPSIATPASLAERKTELLYSALLESLL